MLPTLIFGMSSCLSGDKQEDYSGWRQENISYIEKAEAETENGKAKYEKIIPKWDKSSFVLMDWHNDRTETERNLSPLDNSTCNVKYLLTNIKGDTLDSSYALTDSIFKCKPNEMITGFWIALTNMHIGDSVTTVIPYTVRLRCLRLRFGPPFSTLIFQIEAPQHPRSGKIITNRIKEKKE